MLTLLLTLLLVPWGLAAGWFLATWWQARVPAVRHRVLINCDDDTAVRGILIEVRGDWLVVQQAELLRAEGAPAALDGRTLIPRARVSFLQVLP